MGPNEAMTFITPARACQSRVRALPTLHRKCFVWARVPRQNVKAGTSVPGSQPWAGTQETRTNGQMNKLLGYFFTTGDTLGPLSRAVGPLHRTAPSPGPCHGRDYTCHLEVAGGPSCRVWGPLYLRADWRLAFSASSSSVRPGTARI